MEHGRTGREVTWAVVIKAVRQREQVANKAAEGASWPCGEAESKLVIFFARSVCRLAVVPGATHTRCSDLPELSMTLEDGLERARRSVGERGSEERMRRVRRATRCNVLVGLGCSEYNSN
jgi:hypothetical protein